MLLHALPVSSFVPETRLAAEKSKPSPGQT
jgi:hypothetical protein